MLCESQRPTNSQRTEAQINESVKVNLSKPDVRAAINTAQTLFQSLSNASDTLWNIGKQCYKEARSVNLDDLSPKDVRVIPTCVENLLGDDWISQICDDTQVSKNDSLNALAQEVAVKLFSQVKREGLKMELRVKESDEENAFSLPGGKIVITTGLLKKLQEGCTEEESKTKLAAIFGQLIATSEKSHVVKETQLRCLLGGVKKVANFVVGRFFPDNKEIKEEDKRKEIEEENKHNKGIRDFFTNAFGLGEKVFINYLQQSNKKEVVERGIQMAKDGGYEQVNEKYTSKLFSSLFPEIDGEVTKGLKREALDILYSLVT